MSDVESVISRLDTLLGDTTQDLYGQSVKFDWEIYNRMFQFITSLDPSKMEDDQIQTIMGIIEDIEFEESEDLD
jgi:hypothetical protein